MAEFLAWTQRAGTKYGCVAVAFSEKWLNPTRPTATTSTPRRGVTLSTFWRSNRRIRATLQKHSAAWIRFWKFNALERLRQKAQISPAVDRSQPTAHPEDPMISAEVRSPCRPK